MTTRPDPAVEEELRALLEEVRVGYGDVSVNQTRPVSPDPSESDQQPLDNGHEAA